MIENASEVIEIVTWGSVSEDTKNPGGCCRLDGSGFLDWGVTDF